MGVVRTRGTEEDKTDRMDGGRKRGQIDGWREGVNYGIGQIRNGLTERGRGADKP